MCAKFILHLNYSRITTASTASPRSRSNYYWFPTANCTWNSRLYSAGCNHFSHHLPTFVRFVLRTQHPMAKLNFASSRLHQT